MVHTYRIWKTSNLTLDLEIHQHLGSLKYVINIIMCVRDMGCYIHAIAYSSLCDEVLLYFIVRVEVIKIRIWIEFKLFCKL
jgi:hypothetical protein